MMRLKRSKHAASLILSFSQPMICLISPEKEQIWGLNSEGSSLHVCARQNEAAGASLRTLQGCNSQDAVQRGGGKDGKAGMLEKGGTEKGKREQKGG